MKRSGLVAVVMVLAAVNLVDNEPRAQVGPGGAQMGFELLAQAAYERSQHRLEGVNYLVKRMESTLMPFDAPPGAGPCAMGGCVAIKNENGATRILTPTEVQVLAGLAADSARMTGMGIGMIQAQGMINDGMKEEMMAQSPELGMLAQGLAAGNLGGAVDPWVNPFQMIGLGGAFVLAGAQALDEAAVDIARGAEVARAEQQARRELMERGQYVGSLNFNGHTALEYLVEGINQVIEVDGGGTFTMVDARMWFDADELVMLKHRIDGIARQDGNDVPFYIETESKDYRNVPGSNLYEPYETVSRMGGMLDEKQMAEMAEAKAQLDEFDKQMAAMPRDQRAMVENMMGGQMDMLRTLVDTGAFESSQKVLEIYVNPDLAALYGANVDAAAAMGEQQGTGGNLIARIQSDLHELGYDPGPVNGELTTPTVIAISQFQSEKGLEVTGEATESLASVLADELGR